MTTQPTPGPAGQAWTPEPWHFCENQYSKAIMGPITVPAQPGRPVKRNILISQFGMYTDKEADAEANARRAIECVNAMAGIANPAQALATLRREKEELREALDLAVATLANAAQWAPTITTHDVIQLQCAEARALLARTSDDSGKERE